jgi:hypothetical protein
MYYERGIYGGFFDDVIMSPDMRIRITDLNELKLEKNLQTREIC